MSSKIGCRRVMHATGMHIHSYISMYHYLFQTWWSERCERIYLEEEISRLVLSHVPLLIPQDHPVRDAAQICME